MKRRDSIKAILVGTVASSVLVDACKSADEKTKAVEQPAASTIDRMKEEAEYEAKLEAEKFFTAHEMATIAVTLWMKLLILKKQNPKCREVLLSLT